TKRTVDLIDYIFTPIIIILGLIGNTLSIHIMFKKRNRKTSTCIYMGILAIVDNGQMVTVLTTWLYNTIIKDMLTDDICKATIFFTGYFADFSIYLVILMTIDRMLAITMPFKKSWRSVPKICILIGCLMVFIFIRTIPLIVYGYASHDNVFNQTTCSLYTKNIGDFEKMLFPVLDIVIQSVLPSLSLLICNSIIVHKLRKRKQQISSLGIVNSNSQNAIFMSWQKSVTVMLLLISFASLILTLPMNIGMIMIPIIDEGTIHPDYIVLFEILWRLFFLNNAVNFYLCLIGGTRFKREVKKLFQDSSLFRLFKHSTGSSDSNNVITIQI
ncbi:unnamed protein product, partial [Owenia fusiformis]